mmetsp:Transcript_18999/g.55148  ORF Transcript_18999/g.55148 Transcript_18999/m.55148 type:complete len:269 (-) Transcript_18999:807-1613(-)
MRHQQVPFNSLLKIFNLGCKLTNPSPQGRNPTTLFKSLILVILGSKPCLVIVNRSHLPPIKGPSREAGDGPRSVFLGGVLEEDLRGTGPRPGDDYPFERSKLPALLSGVLQDFLVLIVVLEILLGEHLAELNDARGVDGVRGRRGGSGTTTSVLAGELELPAHVFGEDILPIPVRRLGTRVLGWPADAELGAEVRDVVQVERRCGLVSRAELDEGELPRRAASDDGITGRLGEPNLLHGLPQKVREHLLSHFRRSIPNEQLAVDLVLC